MNLTSRTNMGYGEQIDLMIKSFCPLFYIGSPNRKLTKEICCDLGDKNLLEVIGYNLSQGIWRPDSHSVKNSVTDPIEMLDKILALHQEPFKARRKLFLLEYFDILLANRDPLVLTKLRLINDQGSARYTVILLGGPTLRLPRLLQDIPRLYVDGLDSEDMVKMLKSCQDSLTKKETHELSTALNGLTALECENLLAFSLAAKGRLDCKFLGKEKALLLSKRTEGLIDLSNPDGINLDRVGGLDILKAWLNTRGRFLQANGHGNPKVPAPKGILLTGPPGCGKSFLVNALAGSWGINLIRLDPSRLFSSLVGETEQNLRTVLSTIEALSPCILWIDEFEKFFPRVLGESPDGGVLSRTLGIFLNFLQTRREGVFVCGTTNEVINLPPEIMRAGRFDALFFIDLPNAEERRSILRILLERFGLEDRIDLTDALIDGTRNFTGAELEQAVIDTFYDHADSEESMTSFALLKTVREMVPLAVTMEEKISAMRSWCYSRARLASHPEESGQRERGKICRISPKSRPN